MAEIIAEFHYWDYGEYSAKAMNSRSEVKTEELEKIGREFNVDIKVMRTSSSYFASMKIGWHLPRYNKVIIQVVGECKEDVKSCVGRILLRYGRPDEIPSVLFGGKREGRMIIEELLKEVWGGKR